jgi:hypothetical protein
MSMSMEEARSVSPGTVVYHDCGIPRTIEKKVKYGNSVVVRPRLRGKGVHSELTLIELAKHHSLENGKGNGGWPGTYADPNYKPAVAKLPDPVELMARGVDDSDLYFIACKLVELKKAGAITLHNIRAEAYFACLEAEL